MRRCLLPHLSTSSTRSRATAFPSCGARSRLSSVRHARVSRSSTRAGGSSTWRRRGKADFFIVVAPAGTDVTHVAAIDRKRQGIGARTNGSTLLVYLLSSARVARLRAALAGLP